jgi:glutaredoxin
MSETASSAPQNGRESVDTAISNPQAAVVLFSLSWCSFCHAAKQLLGQVGVQYRVIELDQGEFLEPNLQREVRTRLQEITRSNTLPQLFIGEEGIGGYTETAVAYRTGKLAQLLHKHGIASKLPSPD